MDAAQVLRKQAKDILELAGLEDVSSVQSRFTEVTPSQIKQSTLNSPVNTSTLNKLRTQAGENNYDDTGLNNFL